MMMLRTSTTKLTTSAAKRLHTVVVALSSGVDSSVAAALLLQNDTNNNPLIGVHMSNWNFRDENDSLVDDDESSSACTSDKDWKDSVAVAQHLNIPIVRRSFESDYWCHVFEPYVENIRKGIMGNPDIACNTHVKFGALLQYCKATYGDDVKLATGHYARLWNRSRLSSLSSSSSSVFVNGKGRNHVPECVQASQDMNSDDIDWLLQWGDDPLLLAAADSTKDQTYFLADCNSKAFRNVLFPLGDYYKKTKAKTSNDDSQNSSDSRPTVRDIATSLHLPSASKRESMGICFVGKRQTGFKSFLANYLPPPQQKLQFVDVNTGDVLHQTSTPEHAVFYTPGQKARLSGKPTKYFIVDNGVMVKDRDLSLPFHTINVCAGTHHPALYSDHLYLTHIHWLANVVPIPLHHSNRMRVQCRIRHLQPLVDCTLTIDDKNTKQSAASSDSLRTNSITVVFDVPVRGITTGQTAVFYCGLVCLGGGPIASSGSSYFEQGRSLPSELHPAGHNDLSVPPHHLSICQEETG